MILRYLELMNFGRFREGRFAFQVGPNLVLGRNEVGKSTLMEGLPAALFGTRRKDRFQKWGKIGGCRVAVELSRGERKIRIARDILTDQLLLEEEGGGAPPCRFEGKASPSGRSSEREEYLDRISSYFGVAEEEIFRASLFYGQGSLEIEARMELEGKVKKLLSGSAEVDYDKVLASLQEDYFQVTRHNPWGKDKTQERELEKVRRRLAELDRCRRENGERIDKLELLQKNITGLKTDIERDRREVDKGRRYLHWVRSWLQMEEKERRLQENYRRLQQETAKVECLHREKQEIEKSLGEICLSDEIAAVLSRVVPEIQQLRRKSLALQGQISGIYTRMPAGTGAPWGVIFFLSILLTGAGAVLLQSRADLLAPAGLVAGLVISMVFLQGLRSSSRMSEQKHVIRGQAQILEENLEETRRRLVEMEGVLEKNDLKHGETDLEGLRELLARHRVGQQRLREIHGALEVLEDIPQLEEEKAILVRELAILRERKGESEGAKKLLLKPEEVPEAEGKLAALEKRLGDRERELAECLREESFLLGELGDFHRFEEEAAFLKERERSLGERKDVLALAFNLLNGAVEDFRSDSLKKFASDVGRALAVITAGKYGDIRMEDGFRLLLREEEGEWQPLECFSRGTVDAVFFAVRMVLTRQVFGGRQLPLLLDDPMVNFDSQRLADTLRYLETTACEHQIILFSHNQGLLSLIDPSRWNVMTLVE